MAKLLIAISFVIFGAAYKSTTRNNVILGNRKFHNILNIRDSTTAQVVDYAKYRIISSDNSTSNEDTTGDSTKDIILTNVAQGWGNGAHPTTKLCLDFIWSNFKPGQTLLDYGTGSGILSILAAKLGANKCIAVDIDEDTLRAAENNVKLNNVDGIVEIVHTKEIYFGEDKFPVCDVTVANILPGPLSRLVAPIWSFTSPGGWLCISGLRPHELRDIQRAYDPFVQAESGSVQLATHPIYGDWVSWKVRMRVMGDDEIRQTRKMLTEMSVG